MIGWHNSDSQPAALAAGTGLSTLSEANAPTVAGMPRPLRHKVRRSLIDTMAIRIHANSFRIITNPISNRHSSGPRQIEPRTGPLLALSLPNGPHATDFPWPPGLWRPRPPWRLIADPRLEFRLTTWKINHLNFSNRRKIALSPIVWKSLGVLGVLAVNPSGLSGSKLQHPQETKIALPPSKSPRALSFEGVYTRLRFLGRYL